MKSQKEGQGEWGEECEQTMAEISPNLMKNAYLQIQKVQWTQMRGVGGERKEKKKTKHEENHKKNIIIKLLKAGDKENPNSSQREKSHIA